MGKETVLKNISTGGFMGLGANSPLLIDFGNFKDKHKSNIMTRVGDGNLGKTRFLYFLQYCMGVDLDVKNDKLPNFETGKMNGTFEFEHNGFDLRVKFTKSRFVVEELVQTSTGKNWVEKNSPKSLLEEIFKTASVDMNLKHKSGQQQVEWYAKLFPLEGEYKEAIEKYTHLLEDKIEKRKQLNRDKISKKGELDNSPTYVMYSTEQDKFVERIENIRKNTFDESGYEDLLEKKATKALEADRLNNFKRAVANEEEKLKSKQEELKRLQAEIAQTEENIKKGKKSIKNQKKVVDSLKGIDEKVEEQKALKETFDVDKRAVEAYDNMLDKLAEYEKIEEQHQLIDSESVNLKGALIKARKEASPVIKNVEVVVDVFDHEEGEDDKEKGIYFKGVPLSNLSGSHYIECIISMMEASGADYIYIDDFGTYGSSAVKYIKALAKKLEKRNGMIFATEMARGQKIKISTL